MVVTVPTARVSGPMGLAGAVPEQSGATLVAHSDHSSAQPEPSRRLLIAESEVDPTLRQVRCGDQIRRISVKANQVLATLVAAEGGVISRGALLEQVWPEVTVGEEVLTQAIAELRRAFQDSAKAPRVIGTIPKAGYRLLVPVEFPADTVESAEPSAPAREPARQIAPDPTEGFVLGREHKQVTVLDCGLTGAGELAAALDAETMAEIIDRLHREARTVVARYEGTVAQWLGDGFVALFGAPQAVEDHPRRAIGAAMELVRRLLADTGADTDKITGPLSIGLHTGPAVVGLREADPPEVFTAVGITTETAKRLRHLAPPATVLASAETCDIVGSEVVTSAFAAVSDSGPVFRVHEFRHRRSGVPRRARPSLSRFVGRSRELDMLQTRISALGTSGGQVIDIVGEPGIGKSRLVDEVEAQLDSGVRFLRTHCLPHGRSSPYLPLAALLRELCAALSANGDENLEADLADQLTLVGLEQPETRALLSQLLGLEHEAGLLERLTPEDKQVQVFDSLHRLVSRVAETHPVVLLVEDLHWIDATSQAWLAEEAVRLSGRPVLLLTTRRPGHAVPWQGLSSATQIALPSLVPDDSRALVRSVPKRTPLSDAGLDAVVTRAQGNPFFLEELAVANAGAESDIRQVPDTVQAVIAARIDRLPPTDKRVLRLAAVIGARIPLDLLARVDRLDTGQRRESLRRLQEAELLYERRGAPENIFAFQHALTQDVAYQGLVAKTRRGLHREIADVLGREFSPLVTARPEILARHLTEAGHHREAIAQWHAAGRKAAAQASGIEAVAHYETALGLLDDEPDVDEMAATKVDILVDLGAVLQAVRGAGADEVGQVYRRARDLSRNNDEPRPGFTALWGLWRYRVLNGEFQDSGAIADELIDIATAAKDVEMDLHAHHAVWTTARFTGSLSQAIDHANIGLELAEPRFHTAPHYAFGGHDPICCAYGTRAIVLDLQGKHDAARADMATA